MTCEFFSGGRCALAELHARAALKVTTLECRPDEDVCGACLARGLPRIEKPSVPCIGLATAQLSKEQLPAWRRYVGATLFGNGVQQDVQPEFVERPNRVQITADCAHRGKILETFNCGCAGGGKRHLYECSVAGKCCLKEEHVERAVESLRKTGVDRSDRRVRGCDNCPDRLPLIQLSLPKP